MNIEETDRDEFSVEYVVVANDLILALIREVEDLRREVGSARFSPVDAWPFQPTSMTADAMVTIESQPEPEPRSEVEPAALSEVDQARREAAAEEAAFRARIAQEPVEGDGIIDTSTWPVHELGETGGFR